MTTSRNLTLRLFPLDNKYIAVSAFRDNDVERGHNLFLTFSASPSHSYAMTTKFHPINHFQPFILPNGYYYYNMTIGNIDGGVNKRIDEYLDTSLAAIFCEMPGRYQMLGVDKNRNKVYLYTITTTPIRDVTSGVLIFKTDQEHISSITAFPNSLTIAIALNTGEIILKKNDQVTSLQTPSQNRSARIQLLSSRNDLLIAHDPDNNTLTIWDLTKNACCLGVYLCPEMCNLSISIDGKYLTARELSENEKQLKKLPTTITQNADLYFAKLPQDIRLMTLQYINQNLNTHDQSDLIHCFELNPFKHHRIKLEKPVTDFVIGHNNQVCMIYPTKSEVANENNNSLPGLFSVIDNNYKREFPGSIKELLLKKLVLSGFSSLFRRNEKDDQPKGEPNELTR